MSRPNTNDYEYRVFSYEGFRQVPGHKSIKFERNGIIVGYAIHAVCKDEDGNLHISKHTAYPRFNPLLDDLQTEAERYQKAFNKPILCREDFGCYEYA